MNHAMLQEGNTLALVDALRRFVRATDGDLRPNMNSHFVGAARQLGMREEDIVEALKSERQLTIYEP